MAELICTTTTNVPGRQIQAVLGVVSGQGTPVPMAVKRMLVEASGLGGDAVVCVRLIPANLGESAPGVIVAYGTAVKLA